MPWTPLHDAVGANNDSLTFTLVEQACADGIEERGSLDWKQTLPLHPGSTSAQQEELAKDIAAMANSGGGMIVYGVAEKRGSSAVDRITPIGRVDEPLKRQIRQVAGNLIYPPVAGLELIALIPPDSDEKGVLAMLIPDSPDAPHLVHKKGDRSWFGAPWRNGPETAWMLERQIDTAYRQRDQSRRAILAGLNDLYSTFARSCGAADVIGASPVWVIAVARPDRPHHRPRALQLPKVNRAIGSAASASWRPAGISPIDLVRDQTTRRGLRMFFRSSREGRPTSFGHRLASVSARVEVHGDGCCVAAGFTRDGLLGQEHSPGHIPVDDLETVGLDLFALLEQVQRIVSVTCDYTGRIGVEPITQIFRHRDETVPEHFRPFDEARRVTHYSPVDGPIMCSHGATAALDSWLDIIRDAVHQTGTTSRLG